MKAHVVTLPEGTTKAIEINDQVWQAPFNADLVQQYIRVYTTNQHQGTRQTKRRGEIDRPDRKPWPQKGTGRARHGSKNSPLWVGGGKAHGPRAHTTRLAIPKKMAQGALRAMLSAHLKTENVMFGEYGTKIKTKYVQKGREMLDKLGWRFSKIGVVVSSEDEILKRMLKNLPMVTVFDPKRINAYNVMNVEKLLVSPSALAQIEERLCSK